MDLIEIARAWLSEQGNINGVVGSLIAAAILAMPLYAARLTRFLLKHTRLGFVTRSLAMTLGWVLAAYFLTSVLPTKLVFVGLAAGLTGSIILMARPFIHLGLVDAHTRTRAGIDFKASLAMANSSIDFLGIGADKLTSLPSFKEAMLRCATSGHSVRLLLSPLDNPILEWNAKRNGVDPLAYKGKVRESLERIARLKKQHDLAIEVRFYSGAQKKDLQQFRLMFIDGWICLAGWTVWGSHVGTDNPQLVLKNHPRAHPNVSAYKAFHDYFEALWEDTDTKPVKLSDYE